MGNKQEQIKELFNSYIDNELSERKRNEVKRLMDNDPKVRTYVERLEKLKKLVASVEGVSAPDGIEQAVRDRIERRLILNEYDRSTKEVVGQRHHRFRRMMGIAAMIALFAFLGVIVFQVISPSSSSQDVPLTALKDIEPLMRSELEELEKADVYNLNLKTENVRKLAGVIDQALDNKDLADGTVKRLLGNSYVYEIQCTSVQAENILVQMGENWSQIQGSEFYFDLDGDAPQQIKLTDVSYDQAAAIVASQDDALRLQKAERFAKAKDVSMGVADEIAPEPVKPRLTSAVAEKNSATQDKKIILKITVAPKNSQIQ